MVTHTMATKEAPDPLAETADEALRFVDVMDELACVRNLARGAGEPGTEVADACARLEVLFLRLQRQFLRDVVIAPERAV